METVGSLPWSQVSATGCDTETVETSLIYLPN